mgnify:CR=1 FL=1
MSFGARLKEERKRLKLTQTQLAELAGTTKSTQLLYEKETITGDEFMAILNGNNVQAEAKPETAIEAKEADDNEKAV